MKQAFRKVAAAVLTFAMLGLVATATAACGNKSDDNTLVYWCFDSAMKSQVEDFYPSEEELGYKVSVEVIELGSLQKRLDDGLRTGKNLPDVVALEAGAFKKYMSGDLMENLDDLRGVTSDMYDYTVDAATGADGHLYALATNVTPVVFAYKRPIALDVFNTDDPVEIQKRFDTWEHFVESARALKEKGYKVTSSYMDMAKVFFGGRSKAWVDQDNNLVMDETLTDGDSSLMDLAKTLHTEGLSNEQAENSGTWYSDISGPTVFGYFQATWGIETNLQRNAVSSDGKNNTYGKWALIQGPASAFEGGTFHAVVKGTKMLDKAKDFVKFFSTDATYLETWAKENNDFMNSKSVMKKLAEDTTLSSEFLGGQNPYSIYITSAEKINGSIITKYDSTINGSFKNWAVNYAEGIEGAATKEKAISEFKNALKNIYQDIKIV